VFVRSLMRIRCRSEDDTVVAGVPPAHLENCSRHGCVYTKSDKLATRFTF